MSSKPRTPRYWPRMKVRGARRRRLARWQRTQRAFDRISVSGRVTGETLARFAQAFVMPQRIILGADILVPPQGRDQLMVVTEQASFEPVTADDVERLATSLTKEQA